MPQLNLFLLGPPRLERDGQPVEVDTRKAIALMAYLTVTGESHSRDALATLLWPDYDQTHARGALRRTLSALNKALAGDWLEVDRETIGLNQAAPIWLDMAEFQRRLSVCRGHNLADALCATCLTPLNEAVSLYRDNFMAGFTLRDSPDFDEWQYFQSESLRRELAGALENLVRCHTLQQQFDPAIAYARRWLALDPLHEQAHRELMRLYTWDGQRGAALRQYRECIRIFDQELGVPPLDETTQLYTAIQENRLPAPPQPVLAEEQPTPVALPVTPPPMVKPRQFDYPLVGRSAEWAALLDAYTASVNGRVVIVQGEAGIGKTRLAEEFLAQVEAEGGLAITARCYAGETNLAYSLFSEGLRAALNQPDLSIHLAEVPDHWLSEAALLLPELAALRPGLPTAPPLDSPGAQSRFFEGIYQLLLALCRGAQPGVLFFDDLHWADAASLDLLTYLLRRARGRQICFLLIWRSESAAALPRLEQLLAEAQRGGNATVLSLPRLSPSAVAELVDSVTAGAAGLDTRLYQETEGLPFFLVEYLTVLSRSGEGAVGADWSMPGGVRGLLQSRLAGVSETGWQLLTTAAVIGRSFDFDTLRTASGRSDDEIVTALEALIEQGLVAEIKNGGERGLTYDFSHDKLRTLVYDEASLTRRRLLHRRVAEALISRARGWPDPGALAGQIAYHYRLTGQDSEAADYFKLAGEHARSLYANAESLAHFQAALALGHPDAAALHEAIGDLHTLLGGYNAALTSYETAAAVWGGKSNPDSASVLGRIEHKLGNVHQRRGDWELAESYFQAALTVQKESGLPGENARLYADWSLTAHHRGQTTKALNLAQQARELAETAGDTQALAQAHNILGVLARSQNDAELAYQHLEQSLTMAEALGDPGARIAALNNLALAYNTGGATERAIKLTETALALCVSQGDRHREAALHNNLADLFHAAGQSEAAMTHLKQAVTIFAEIGAQAGAPQPEIWKLVEW